MSLTRGWLGREIEILYPGSFALLHLFFPWDHIRKRAGLNDLRLHDLRHSFASFLVNKGKKLYAVKELLGHKNYRTTQRYAHLSSETLGDAAEAVTDILNEIDAQ